MTTHLQERVTLNNGAKMPWLGLGVFRVEEGAELVEAVKSAIKQGYRSIDTAAIYENEAGVGEGIKQGLEEAGLNREELFVTSKVWNADLSYEGTIQAYEKSLEKLGLEYLDLYLIHWPVEAKYKEAWRALEHLYEEGRVKSIGVSNFQIHHLEDLLKDAKVKPVINQVEYHPRLTQKDLQAFCEQHQIQLEAWSPLMNGQIIEHDLIKDLASTYRKTPAQIVIRWDLQNGVVTIPKSTKAHRLAENADVFDFELSEGDMKQIDQLNEDHRIGPDPDNFDF
ncbi:MULTISPECIES: aldo/keto reductase [unclassified Sutcliffiella]|uniref:aldo/keto reductase n=1 Tax=unclassified Sutcliffiella TaxID=2837532 RepID=UPI0030CF2102